MASRGSNRPGSLGSGWGVHRQHARATRDFQIGPPALVCGLERDVAGRGPCRVLADFKELACDVWLAHERRGGVGRGKLPARAGRELFHGAS